MSDPHPSGASPPPPALRFSVKAAGGHGGERDIAISVAARGTVGDAKAAIQATFPGAPPPDTQTVRVS